ncbi:hypothetical protein J5N97_025748 [Dioscorea zingiberensis]|uniref:Uncharacterized protein n=1 Tax=Dioscorea zingiberensis TaxID=325984 RepID=A0A9D5C165_9LILI|nr:hypothetical protein J5N97_025748 [Dioscorea zingiberensis]
MLYQREEVETVTEVPKPKEDPDGTGMLAFQFSVVILFIPDRLIPVGCWTLGPGVCQKVEKLLKDLFSLYDKENPQSSNDKQSTLSVAVEVEEQESDLFAEYADPDDSSSNQLINHSPSSSSSSTIPSFSPFLMVFLCQERSSTTVIHEIVQDVHACINRFEEQKDQVAVEQILRVVFLDADPDRPCPELEKLKRLLAKAEAALESRKKPPEDSGPRITSEGLVINEWVIF